MPSAIFYGVYSTHTLRPANTEIFRCYPLFCSVSSISKHCVRVKQIMPLY